MPIATPQIYNEMLDRAKADQFAYPAINVTSSETLNAALRGFAEAGSDGIVQMSTGGAEFASGSKVKDMVTGAVAMAEFAHVVAAKYPINVVLHTDHCPPDKLDHYVRPLIAISQQRVARGDPPLFQSHMWDGSAISLQRNLTIAAELLALCTKTQIILEVEIGVVGGEEDGITGEINEKLYTTAEDFERTIDVLGGGDQGRYLLAATFGNVHGVYQPGHVQLRPEILQMGQQVAARKPSPAQLPGTCSPITTECSKSTATSATKRLMTPDLICGWPSNRWPPGWYKPAKTSAALGTAWQHSGGQARPTPIIAVVSEVQ
jgi:fructose-bisphosphate aldolase class II